MDTITTQPVETRKPSGQGNSGWLTDAMQGKGPAFPRKPAPKPGATPAGSSPASTQAPPVETGTTVQPASVTSPEPVQTIQTPATPTPEAIPAAVVPPATGQQPQPATPVAAALPTPAQPVVTIDDPNTVIQIKNPDGTVTEKTVATMKWEENMRSNLNRKDSEIDRKQKDLEARERELAERERALQTAPVQPQQTVPIPDNDPMPLPPVGKVDGVDPEWDVYRAELPAWHLRQSVKPLTDAIKQAQATSQESQRQKQLDEDNYRHNFYLTDTVLPSMLPFDLNALAASDPAAYQEALGRLRMAGLSKGIDLSPEGMKRIQGKLDESTIEVIALRAFNDGWNPTLRKAAPAAQVPAAPPAAAPIDPVAAELSRKLREGEPLVMPGEPTQPLVPIAPSGSPAGNNPNRPSQGTSSSSVPKWRQPLGQGK